MAIHGKLDTWDFVAVGIYFVAVIGTGLMSMCRSNRGTVSGYFLAGRFMIWLPVGASLFASNIGSEHFIGLAGSGAASGIGVGAFELNACLLLQLLGWIFLPVYIASGVCTLPEFMKKRFGGNRIRIYLASLSLLLYIFTKISVNLYSGALFIQQSLGWNLYLSILLLLAITAFCTVTGGLAAVIYTDTLQAFVMVIGSVTLMIISFLKVGGLTGLYEKYEFAIAANTTANATCGQTSEMAWTMLRPADDKDMPWPGFLLGQTPASVWYWCADQMMVQRSLAAKSLSHAQGGTLFAGYLKILPLFMMIMPGMISRVLFPEEVACSTPERCFEVCENRAGCTNIAYPKLVLELMPTGLKGVMLAVMLSALMSDLTSIFNSASTLFTMDIYKNFRRKANVRELMVVGRLFVVFMTGIGIVWIPLIQEMQGGQLFIYIQVISAYLAPPIASVYVIAVLWTRGNEKGAFWGLMMGFMVGITRMILDFIYREPECGEPDTRPFLIANIHYMYFATILFWVTALTMIVISLITGGPKKERLIRTTFWTRFDKTVREDETEEYLMGKHADSSDEQEGGAGEEKEVGDAPLVGKGDAPLAEAEDTHEKDGSLNGNAVAYVKVGMDDGGEGQVVWNGKLENTDGVKIIPQREKTLWRRGYNWFCGFEDETSGSAMMKAKEMAQRLQKITNLEQNPKIKLFLNVNLGFIICIATVLYVYFTFFTYTLDH